METFVVAGHQVGGVGPLLVSLQPGLILGLLEQHCQVSVRCRVVRYRLFLGD